MAKQNWNEIKVAKECGKWVTPNRATTVIVVVVVVIAGWQCPEFELFDVICLDIQSYMKSAFVSAVDVVNGDAGKFNKTENATQN